MGEVLPFRARVPRAEAAWTPTDLIAAALVCADVTETVLDVVEDPECAAALRAARADLNDAIDDALDAAR